MRVLKLLLFVFFVFVVCVVNAQSKPDTTFTLKLIPDTCLLSSNLKVLIKNQQVDTFWVNNCMVTVKCENTQKTVEMVMNAMKKSTIVRTFGTVDLPNQSQSTLKASTSKGKYDSKIDEFLNIEDETIFSDEKFITLQKEQLHPRSYKYYCLISNIHQFGKMMENVGQMLAQLQMDKVKSLLNDISDLRDNILSFQDEILCLSATQKNYYNKLNDKYEEMRESLNLDK